MRSKRVTAPRIAKRAKPRYSTITRSLAQMVLDVREFFEREEQQGRSTKIRLALERTCEATKVSKFVVDRIRSQYDVDSFPQDGTIIRKRKPKVPHEFVPIIRVVVRDMIVKEKCLPSLSTVWDRLTSGSFDMLDFSIEKPVWNWSVETLRRFMLKNGFGYTQRRSHYEYTKERQDILEMRDNYLEWIKQYRESGYRIFYQDETWVFKNMAPNKVWQPVVPDPIHGVDYKVPSGSGDRSIVCHLGSKDTGLLEGCLLLFTGRKRKNPDYHSEMNQEVFLMWLKETVFPKLKEMGHKVVLVLDRAKYHTMLTEDTKGPTTGWRKQKLVDAIKSWGEVPDDWPLLWWKVKTKPQLLAFAKKIKQTPKYLVQELADSFTEGQFCIKIIFLPVAHPELNPIEMVWGGVKRAVASGNMSHNLTDVEKSTRLEVEKYTKDVFGRYSAHAEKEEEKYRQMGTIMDNVHSIEDNQDLDFCEVFSESGTSDGEQEDDDS